MLDLGRTFLQSMERSPTALAIVDGERRLSYAEWGAEIAKLVGGLERLGLMRGDRVLAVLQNRYEMATLHWACQFLGLVITPLNWRAKPEEVGYCIQDAQVKAVFYEAVSEEAVLAAPESAGIARVSVGAVQQPEGMSFEALQSRGPSELIPCADSGDYSLMLYTSGTTGKPKGVPRRHRHERAAALGHVAQNLYLTGERTLGVMPLYHTMGVRSLLSMALVDGVFVCMPRFDAHTALDLIESEKISCLYLVPTLYHEILGMLERRKADIASVRKLGFAGAPMSDGLLKKVQQTFQPELFVNHYGSSEIYTVSINQRALEKPGCAGRAGINARLKLVKLDAAGPDDQVAPGVEGQIIADLMGDEAFEGYWNRPDADAKSIREGWYFTGDTGYVDGDGDLFVTGRVDDMIISGGENISPVDIESVLSLHDAVDEVAVTGLPDEKWGQRVVAFVKRKHAIDAQELDAHCRRSDLLNFKRPREYVFVREIPKSPVGKILRRKLVAGEYESDKSTGVTET